MKHLSLVLALALLAAPLISGRVVAVTTYTDSLAGEIIPPGSSSLSLGAVATGALPGSFTISLNLNNTTVTNGNWWLVVKERNADGSVSEVGALAGAVSGGTVSLNADGRVTSLNSVQLLIQTGSGNYAGVTSGSGSLTGTFGNQASPSFSGTLNLNF